MTDAPRYRLDDIRRLGSALAAGVGMAPARASALATHLLWYDAAGLPAFGIATLPTWLERIEAGQVEPSAEGDVAEETIGTAVFDGRNGVAPLILGRAGELAVEKARDAGVGLVRVRNVGPSGPATAVAAAMATGPVAALLLGPGPSWTLAIPSPEGLPAVVDSEPAPTTKPPSKPPSRSKSASRAEGDSVLSWLALLAPEGGWLVAALRIGAFEPLEDFHERVASSLERATGAPGRLLPTSWETRRDEAREHGIAIAAGSWKALARWADRVGGASLPSPISESPRIPPGPVAS